MVRVFMPRMVLSRHPKRRDTMLWGMNPAPQPLPAKELAYVMRLLRAYQAQNGCRLQKTHPSDDEARDDKGRWTRTNERDPQQTTPKPVVTLGTRQTDPVTFDGSPELGQISPAIAAQSKGALQPLPIRLLRGWSKPKGTHTGFGLIHIFTEHNTDLGVKTLEEAALKVRELIQNTEKIFEEQSGVYFFRVRNNPLVPMIRLTREGDHYTVHTVYEKNQNKGKLVWSGRPDALVQGQKAPMSVSDAPKDITTTVQPQKSLVAALDHRGLNKSDPVRYGRIASQTNQLDFTPKPPLKKSHAPRLVLYLSNPDEIRALFPHIPLVPA
jgi:hypothetical protein